MPRPRPACDSEDSKAGTPGDPHTSEDALREKAEQEQGPLVSAGPESPCDANGCGALNEEKESPSSELSSLVKTHYEKVRARLDTWRVKDEQFMERLLSEPPPLHHQDHHQDHGERGGWHITEKLTEHLHHMDESLALLPVDGHSAHDDDCFQARRKTVAPKLRTSSTQEILTETIQEAKAEIDKAWKRSTSIVASSTRRTMRHDPFEEAPSVQKILADLISHTAFDVIISVFIALNCIIIGAEVDYMTRHTEMLPSFFIIQTICSLVFLVELLLRLGAERLQFFLGAQIFWNYLDLFLVVSSCIELFVISVGMSAEGFRKAQIIRIMRVMKMIRILRISRIVRFIRALRIMLHSIVDTLKSVVWAMLLLCMILYFFGIIITQAVTDHLRASVGPSENEALLRLHFGNLGVSMLTLFKGVTGGMDWGDALELLVETGAVSVMSMFIYIVFTYFAVLNVITGAFCQGALESRNYDRELTVQQLLSDRESDLYRATDLFRNMLTRIDANGSGTVSAEEFEQHLEDDSVQAALTLLELNTGDAWALFNMLDDDGSHDLDVDEFICGCLRLKGGARSIDLAVLANETRKNAKKLMQFSLENRAEICEVRHEVSALRARLGLRPQPVIGGKRHAPVTVPAST